MDTSHSKDPELAAPPRLVLEEQEGQQHEEAPVVDHPPHVHRAFVAVLVAGIPVDALGHQHG